MPASTSAVWKARTLLPKGRVRCAAVSAPFDAVERVLPMLKG